MVVALFALGSAIVSARVYLAKRRDDGTRKAKIREAVDSLLTFSDLAGIPITCHLCGAGMDRDHPNVCEGYGAPDAGIPPDK